MEPEEPWPVVLLPGGILPAQPAYEALPAELGDAVDARVKDLEMYVGEMVPPPGYSLATEVGSAGSPTMRASRPSTSSDTQPVEPRHWRSPRAIPSAFGASP
jgi:hypothetical protein